MSGEILSLPAAMAYLFTSLFTAEQGMNFLARPLFFFFLAECYRQILMSTESTNDLCVSGNRRTPLFRSSEERREEKEKKREKRGLLNSIALLCFCGFYSDYSQNSKTRLTVLLCHCLSCLVDVMV